MAKRLLTLLLCLALLGSVWAEAAVTGSAANFTAVRTYGDRFSDVSTANWYYDNVKTLYELGLAQGRDARTFAPRGNVTVGEAAAFAARLLSLYELGDAESGPAAFGGDGGAWYLPYVRYLQDRGVIAQEFEGRYTAAATRAQMAHITARILPESELPEINADAVAVGYATRQYIQDVDDYTPYQQEILQLYKWGIVSGSDDAGNFRPDSSITRAEYAALLTRLADPDLRVRLDWNGAESGAAQSASYQSLVEPGTLRRSHLTGDTAAIDNNIRWMLAGGGSTLTLQMEPVWVTTDHVNLLMQQYLNQIRQYIEQGYNAVSCTYSADTGEVTLRFYSSIFSDQLFSSARRETLQRAVEIRSRLYQDGLLRSGMSEYEKARAYFTWLCENCAYDYRADDASVSHTAYSAFFMGSAVCDGYVAAYNLLLKLEGISCGTVSTADHIWTVAELDGRSYHIDPTWGAQRGTVEFRYFGMTEAQAAGRFS